MNKDKLYLQHILEAIISIEFFSKDKSIEDFYADDMMQSAFVRKFEIIGEASKRISDDLKDQYNNIAWKQATDMRNILIHDYFRLDIPIVWQTIKNDLPILKQGISNILSH